MKFSTRGRYAIRALLDFAFHQESDTDYRMWYGSDSGIGYATSPDGLTWTEVSNSLQNLYKALM